MSVRRDDGKIHRWMCCMQMGSQQQRPSGSLWSCELSSEKPSQYYSDMSDDAEVDSGALYDAGVKP